MGETKNGVKWGKALAPEQSQQALPALACKARGFVLYAVS